MATPGDMGKRNPSAQSVVLRNLVTATGQINTDANSAVNKLLNEKFTQRNALTQRRIARQDRISKLNREYVAQTQNVLNDKTLAFLVQHSNIDAPTLTSIFAGFELARSSAADKLNELRASEVDRLRALDQVDVDRQANNDAFLDSTATIISEQRDRDLRQVGAAAESLGASTERDVTAAQRLEEIGTRADRADARDAANNASDELQTQIRADAAARRRTGGQSSRLGFILGNTPETPVNTEPPPSEDTTVQEVEQAVLEEEAEAGQQVIDDTQLTPEQTEVNDQALRDNRTELINAIIQEPSNSGAIEQLGATDSQLDLTDQERQLSTTLRTLGTVSGVLDNNPEDEQAITSFDLLSQQAADQSTALSPDAEVARLEEQATAELEQQESTRAAEVEQLTAALGAVDNIISNDALDDADKQGAIASKVDIEERLAELAASAQA